MSPVDRFWFDVPTLEGGGIIVVGAPEAPGLVILTTRGHAGNSCARLDRSQARMLIHALTEALDA